MGTILTMKTFEFNKRAPADFIFYFFRSFHLIHYAKLLPKHIDTHTDRQTDKNLSNIYVQIRPH